METTYKVSINMEVNLKLTEIEVRALDALAGYGVKQFLETFYKQMGKTYLQPHEKGLIDLFEKIRKTCPKVIAETEISRTELGKVLKKANKQ